MVNIKTMRYCVICVWPRQGNILNMKVSDDIAFVTPVCYSRPSNSPWSKHGSSSFTLGLSTWLTLNQCKQSEQERQSWWKKEQSGDVSKAEEHVLHPEVQQSADDECFLNSKY